MCSTADKLKKEGSSTTPKEEGDDGGTLSEEENIGKHLIDNRIHLINGFDNLTSSSF